MLNIDYLKVKVMIHTRDHQTVYLFDPRDYLGPKRKRLLSESWAGLFREHILAELPVHKLARLKAIAVNLFRATAVRKALGLPGDALAAVKSDIKNTICDFKEQFLKHMGQLANIFTLATDKPLYELITAA
jgi:hypothetical protein